MIRITLLLLLFLSVSFAEEEAYLRNIRQLTSGGQNAEAYFSADGKQIIFQSTRESDSCDHVYIMNVDGSGVRKIMKEGRQTCGYFYPDGSRILFSSTHEASPECPPAPDYSMGYVWPLYASYDIYSSKPDGSDLRKLTNSPGYDAEATISPDGKWIVFTSDRDGDLELYRMDLDGRNVRRLTYTPGYDGGAFFSPDSSKIVFRAHHIQDPQELSEYRSLLAKNLVRPTRLEIYVMDADGKNMRQVTSNGAANFCPYFHPDGKRIIFASNLENPRSRNFDLYIIHEDGTGLQKITDEPTFDGFPMFSPDGSKLIFASNRNGKVSGETNIFIADWVNPETRQPSLERLRQHVTFLASDDLKGRLTGTPEAEKAAEYIAQQMQQFGFQPAPGMSGYFQEFDFISGVEPGTENTLEIRRDSERIAFEFLKEFVPSGFSSDAKLTDLPIAFAGYGIRASSPGYDDYKNLDVRGKAVLVLRYGPEGDDPKSQYSLYYPLRYKAMVARDQGAAILLVIHEDEQLPLLRADRIAGPAGIPIVHIGQKAALQIFALAGKKLPDRKNPHNVESADLNRVRLSVNVSLIRRKGVSRNVIGWLPGSVDETVVVGAHYDHLGLGIEGSLAPKPGEIHNGADDNASGVAAMLEIGRMMAGSSATRKKNLLLVAFSGEELGLLGSRYFIQHPPVPRERITAMLNLDMVGRLKDKLIVAGQGTAKEWPEILKFQKPANLEAVFHEDGYGPSDHSSFYAENIPVLFFFTGAHEQYHRPEDDTEWINFDGLIRVTTYGHRIVNFLSEQQASLQFTKAKPSPQEQVGRGFRVYLGTIPDYASQVKGVRVMGVREGSPAEKAGLLAGDIIVELNGKKIENVYDYTYALQEAKPGDHGTLVVLRDQQRLSLSITFAPRPSSTE